MVIHKKKKKRITAFGRGKKPCLRSTIMNNTITITNYKSAKT